MKTFKFLTIFVSLSLINFCLSASDCKDGDCGNQHQHDPPSDEFLIPSDSNCENPTPTHCKICEDEYVYECVNKWIPYNLNDDPATNGLFVGMYKDEPFFVGRGKLVETPSAARIQITDPKGAYMVYAPEQYITDPSLMDYLQKDPNSLYKWVNSSGSNVVPFAVDTGDCNADDGNPNYISKIQLEDGSTTIGYVFLTSGLAYFNNFEGNWWSESEYLVLTCRSKVYEPEPECPSPSEEPSAPASGCVHEWKPYIGDDAPALDGLSAGFFDDDSEAYIGKGSDGTFIKAGRIELNEPGVLITKAGFNYLSTEETQYLVSNPSYTYRWVDVKTNVSISNGVRYLQNSAGGLQSYVARTQINGEMQIGPAYVLGFFPSDSGEQVLTESYQVLVCDPEPSCPCEAKWIPYKNDHAPETDGFAIGYIGDEINYIGRAVQKLPEGYSTVIGRVDLTDGVYYLNDASGDEKLEADEGEYLWKCPDSTYEWVSSHTDKKVWNAIKVPIRCENFTLCESSIGCDEDGRSAYIGRATVDGVSYVGTVYKNEGLVVADSCGNKMTLSNFEVLTCATSGRCQEREQKCGETPCKWQED